jgi:hypothetical protein
VDGEHRRAGTYFPITTFRLPDCPYETLTTFFLSYQATAQSVADTEFTSVLTWLSQLSPVTFFEINQMKGTDVTRLDEASLTTLKNDNVVSERALDGNATVVANAIRTSYPYHEQLIALIDARLAVVNTPTLTTPLYASPPEFPFNFTYMVPTSLDIANALYPDDDLHAEVDVDIVEWNPAVLARQQYAFMTCNLLERAEQVRVGAFPNTTTVLSLSW